MHQDEIEDVANNPLAVPVWVDDKELEVDIYYVSPQWYIKEECVDFISAYKWNQKGDYWSQSSRYVEAVEYFEWCLGDLQKPKVSTL
jgi:hypothetical protein